MIRKIKVEKKHLLAKYLTRLVADVNRSSLPVLGHLPVSLVPADGGVMVRVTEGGIDTKYHIVERKRIWRYTVEHTNINVSNTLGTYTVPDLSLSIRTFLETLNDYA